MHLLIIRFSCLLQSLHRHGRSPHLRCTAAGASLFYNPSTANAVPTPPLHGSFRRLTQGRLWFVSQNNVYTLHSTAKLNSLCEFSGYRVFSFTYAFNMLIGRIYILLLCFITSPASLSKSYRTSRKRFFISNDL